MATVRSIEFITLFYLFLFSNAELYDFESVHGSIRRGDIIGVTGYPGIYMFMYSHVHIVAIFFQLSVFSS